MNKDAFERMKKAKQYQMLAIKALIPEPMAEHVDVIGKEMKEMMIECIFELFSQEKGASERPEKAADNQKSRGAKKIDIG